MWQNQIGWLWFFFCFDWNRSTSQIFIFYMNNNLQSNREWGRSTKKFCNIYFMIFLIFSFFLFLFFFYYFFNIWSHWLREVYSRINTTLHQLYNCFCSLLYFTMYIHAWWIYKPFYQVMGNFRLITITCTLVSFSFFGCVAVPSDSTSLFTSSFSSIFFGFRPFLSVYQYKCSYSIRTCFHTSNRFC